MKKTILIKSATFVKCVECGRMLRAVIPKGGDGTQLNPARHKKGTDTCEGSRMEGEPI